MKIAIAGYGNLGRGVEMSFGAMPVITDDGWFENVTASELHPLFSASSLR